jgi:hypothetical protein
MTKLQKEIQTSDWGGVIWVYISLLITVLPVASKVKKTTRKLYKSRGNIQYLNTLIEVKRFERCIGTHVQFVLEKNSQQEREPIAVSDTTTYL